MRAVVQRVLSASVTVNGEVVSAIDKGLLVLLGVGKDDAEADAAFMAEKLAGLRIFEDEAGKMNRSVMNVGGALLVVSQFTLFGDVKKGKRPSFTDAMEPVRANALYELCCAEAAKLGVPVKKGVFRADMKVALVNDGPVTLLVDSKRLF